MKVDADGVGFLIGNLAPFLFLSKEESLCLGLMVCSGWLFWGSSRLCCILCGGNLIILSGVVMFAWIMVGVILVFVVWAVSSRPY